ncbi:hypothetical protein DOTSEDRAFT_118040 [Dothistroma septosporum NZE10]|uniref:Borealin N-terminal domain-containing protein n=1 Tax=Dothistroma septosporum (strain NZE10 / CBS 128990) TaxID=675120 RepID=N1Q186_DOTSN|nr:hypothetical protein DOTSEDRAFT_118040 [Dothistroma septosporum NZE10]
MSNTPQRSPAKRVAGITQREKQALLDDVQLEITERARKLRAQYALQAQGLRTRLEMRVNRIPQALRKRNIQDLVDEHTAKARPAPPQPMPVASKVQQAKAATKAPAPTKQSSKRKSDDISAGDDKENLPAPSEAQDLTNPKKRTKLGGVVANSKATRTASRKAGPAGVLSPKSHNSRTYLQSPLKSSNLSSAQSAIAPVRASARAPSRQTDNKRSAATSEADGRTSGASDSSAGTTIVTKPGARKAPVAKKMAKTAAISRKAVTAKHDAAPPSTTAGGRTFRKRN